MAIQLDGTTGISTTGNIISNGTITATNIALNNINTVGNISAAGNITAGGALTVGSFAATTLSASGNVTGGNLITAAVVSAASVSASGNVTGNYMLGNGALLTGVITSVANINSGTSNVTVVSSGGNVTVGIGGTGNVAVFASTGEYVTGLVSATGNITGSYFLGNGSALTGIDATSIQNGTSNVKVVSSGGNVTVGVGGTGNVAVFNTGGMSVTGNITGGNVIVGNLVFSTDTISSQDGTITIDPAAVGVTGLVIIQGNLQVNGNTTTINSNVVSTNDLTYNLANNAVNSAAANGGGIEVGPIGSPYITWLYNSTAGSWETAQGISATGNITGGNVSGTSIVGTLTTAAQTNITSVGTLTGLTINNATTAITNGGTTGVGNIGATGATFNTVFAKATTAQYADLAEKYVADAEYPPGTVLVFGGSAEVTVANSPGDTRIAGVVSTNPGFVMNEGLEAQHVVTVALTGRVPTKVTGLVSKGDMMVTAGNGHAHACASPVVGTVIGKALENFDGESGVIEVVVGVR
jgi:hypothetical protein